MPSPLVRRLIGLVAALLTIAGVVGVLQVNAGPSAGSVLDDARAFVKAHPSVRFTGAVTIKLRSGKSNLGSAQTLTSHMTGEIESKGRTHAVIASGDQGASETVTAGDFVYLRSADTETALAKAKYAKIDVKGAVAGVMQDDATQAKDLDVGSMLAAASGPKKISHTGDLTTIEADVSASKLVGAVAAKQIDWITLRIVVRKGGEIRGLVQTTRASTTTIRTTVQYTGWGTAVTVSEPSGPEIDPTPGIEEEKIAAWKDAALFMPKGIPAGWKFDGADVLAKEDTTEGCAEVELDYENPADADNGYLYLYEFPNKCAQPFSGAGVTPFTAGNNKGFGQSSEADGTFVQLSVGATTIQADTDLSLEELAVVLKDLVPLNLSAKPAELAGIGGHQTAV